MLTQKPIIVDTNILFSALLRENSRFSELLLTSEYAFFVCELVFVELFKRKEKIIQLSHLTEEEIIQIYYILLKRLHLYKEDLISLEYRRLAYELCQGVDVSDTPHVALMLQLDGLLWTGDKKLKLGLKNKGFEQFFELK